MLKGIALNVPVAVVTGITLFVDVLISDIVPVNMFATNRVLIFDNGR
jgi:hypothetical protein